MKALLICPEYTPLTFWSFSRALPYIERRAAMPPLGLITVAAMLPEHWELRLIDMNISPLRDEDLTTERAYNLGKSVKLRSREDGLCYGRVRLPRYPLAYADTGQYIRGEGRIWSHRIAGEALRLPPQ